MISRDCHSNPVENRRFWDPSRHSAPPQSHPEQDLLATLTMAENKGLGDVYEVWNMDAHVKCSLLHLIGLVLNALF